jgi:hypothetical protein
MDDREFFCKRHRAELPTFMKVLEAMPVDPGRQNPMLDDALHALEPLRRRTARSGCSINQH